MIDSFRDEHFFLSNFYPCTVEFEGLTYPSSEHAYQAAKTNDHRLRKIFTIEQLTAAQAKRLGQAIPPQFGWVFFKLDAMDRILEAKFQDPSLRADLILTKDEELVEGNDWNDTFWGRCKGKGENHLGRLLMRLRDELK